MRWLAGDQNLSAHVVACKTRSERVWAIDSALEQRRAMMAQLLMDAPRLRSIAINRADAAMGGMLVLPGTDSLPHFVGDPPDWFADLVGNQEYTWTLNRMEHWISLLRAWMFNEDSRYTQRLVVELKDWLSRCICPGVDSSQPGRQFNDGAAPGTLRNVARLLRQWPIAYRATQKIRRRMYLRRRPGAISNLPLGSTPYNTAPWRSLEAGVRMVHVWPVLAGLLPRIAPEDRELAALLSASAQEHGRVLATISPRLWPNADHNHYLMECLGLLSTARHFPHLDESGAWRAQAVREIERCAAAQFTADGGHIEGCPHYHNICVYLLARAVVTANEAGIEFSEELHQVLSNALQHCVQTLRPDGSSVPAGDSDADHLAMQATLFGYLATGDAAPLRAVVALAGPDALNEARLEHFWFLADYDARLREILAASQSRAGFGLPLPRVSWQRELKQATLRTDWGRDAISIFFSCRTPIHNGHAHADPGSFDLTALGVPLLIDPGRLTYAETPDRRRIKSAAWHNTLTIDNREPFEYLNSMHFGRQKWGTVLGVCQQPRLLAAEAMHQNYAPVVHRRLIAILDGQLVLVLDRLQNMKRGSRAQLLYHLDCDRVAWEGSRRAVRGRVGDVIVGVFVTPGLCGTDLPGKVAPMLDAPHNSVRLRFEDLAGAGRVRQFATVILPSRANLPQPQVSDLQIDSVGSSLVCAFRTAGQRYVLNWQPQEDPAAELAVELQVQSVPPMQIA
jgi:hypothetical protein